MADIFLSYARADAEAAVKIKDALEALKLSVFIDTESFNAGEEFPTRLEQEVTAAGVVLSLWNDYALSREWVRTECELALDHKKLLPAGIGPISDRRLTVEFSRLHRTDLTGFDGSHEHKGWRDTVKSIAQKLDRPDILLEDTRLKEAQKQAEEERRKERVRITRLERQNEALRKRKGGLKAWHWYASIITIVICVAAASWFGITYGEHVAANEIRSSIIPPEVQDQIKQFEINSNIDPRDQLADWYSRIPLPRLVEASTMDPEAALLAGWGYKFGVGGTLVNQSEATLMFQRSCDGNLARGCRNLALQYASGLGVAENDELADSLFRRACDLGDDPACLALENRGKLSTEKSISGSD